MSAPPNHAAPTQDPHAGCCSGFFIGGEVGECGHAGSGHGQVGAGFTREVHEIRLGKEK